MYGTWPRMYRRFVDDTFSVVDSRERALQFLDCLNGLHKALKFTMESEEEGQLPFLEVLVMKEADEFATTTNPPSPGCTRGGTVTAPRAKRSPYFGHSPNARRKFARRNISAMRSRSWSQSSVLMVTQSQLLIGWCGMSLRVAQGLQLLQRSPGTWTRWIFGSRGLVPCQRVQEPHLQNNTWCYHDLYATLRLHHAHDAKDL